MTQSIAENHNLGYEKNLLVIEIITNSMSVIGSLFIVLVYIFNRDLHTFAYKLVLLLSIADIIFGIGRMFNFESYITEDYTPENGIQCYTQSFMITYGGISTILATMAISWSLTQSVINGINNLNDYSKYYYIGIFLIPLLISIVPAATGDYGASGISCWIANSSDGSYSIRQLMWRLCLFYIPLWISIIYNFVNYYRIRKYVYSLFIDNSEASKQHKQMIRRLTYYPLIMVICYLFATVNRVYQFFQQDEVETIAYLHVALAGLQGFFNSLVYGFNKQIKHKICKICLRSSKKVQANSQDILEYTSKSSRGESRDPPSSRNYTSSIESSVTAEEDDRFSIQKEMRENLGNDIYQYDSHPGNKVFEIKAINRITQMSELSSVHSSGSIKNEPNSREINLR